MIKAIENKMQASRLAAQVSWALWSAHPEPNGRSHLTQGIFQRNMRRERRRVAACTPPLV